jgi:cytochrome P450
VSAGPARVAAPERPLPSLKLIRTVLRNPIEVWPRAVYEDALYRSRIFGRETVFVMEPDLIRQVLVDEADAFVKAETLRRALRPALGDAILTADGDRWRWQRRAAAPIFRPDRTAAFVAPMMEAAEAARDRLLGAGGEVEAAREMVAVTFDIIARTMLSGAAGVDVDRVERGITRYLDSTSWVIAMTLLGVPPWVPYPGKGGAEAARDYLRGELERVVRERRAMGGEGRDDLVSLLVAAEDPETGRRMSDRDVADNLLTFIAAGHETTALALTWTLYLLSLHPEAADRIAAEAEAVTGGAALAPAHVERLAWTRQVVQEAMRLYPPAPAVVRAATRDVRLGSETVGAGSAVYVPVYSVHRHRALWDDPDAFRPERFAPDAAKARHRFSYLPSARGRGSASGRGSRSTEAVAVLAVLVKAMRLSLRPGFAPELKLRITLRPGTGMPMRVEPR